jgi:hypothetical protein
LIGERPGAVVDAVKEVLDRIRQIEELPLERELVR